MKRLVAALCLLLLPIPAAASAYSTAVLALSPEVYYRLDDSTGTTFADSSGNGYTATLTGTATFGVPGLVIGDTDTAVDFTGGRGAFSPANILPFTIIAIVQGANYGGTGTAVADYRGSSMTIANNHLEWCFDSQDGCGGGSASTTLVDGNAYFLVLEVSSGAATTSVQCSVNDSALAPCNARRIGVSATLESFYFLAHNTFQSNFQGTLDEVSVVPGALTQAQICALSSLAGYGTACSSGGSQFFGVWRN